MKKKTFLFLLLMTAFAISYGQKLEENKVDDFTKSTIKRTSWETLNSTMKFTAFFRVSKINDAEYFDLKLMMLNKIFSITEGQEIMFKFDDDEILTLKNSKTAVTCTGCGARGFSGSAAPGISVSYQMNKEQKALLATKKITKIRIYTSDGYIENDLKEKFDESIKKSVVLVD